MSKSISKYFESKILKPKSKSLLFDDLSNGSTFLGHPAVEKAVLSSHMIGLQL